ncbi:MAG: hypothetical protein IJI14_11220 [Anaerolineaceae bacterium]|nr:hypothetical protein [Anaerolineaceae bacterium]
MSTEKPVIQLDRLLKWIDCPAKDFYEDVIDEKRFDHRSLLRHMIINRMRFGYDKSGSTGKIDMTSWSGEFWTSFLNKNGFPSTATTLRQMNEFYSQRQDAFNNITGEHMKSVNKFHWWELGNDFPPRYFVFRDEVNKYQTLLGFPDFSVVKAFMREYEYYPVTLADCYADYMDAVVELERRKYSPTYLEIDVPVYLDLDDVTIKMNIDLIFEREKIYKKLSDLKPGLIAGSFIYMNQFSDRTYPKSQIIGTADIRYPMIGVEYRRENGEKIKFDGLETIILSPSYRIGANDENQTPFPESVQDAMKERLNRLGYMYFKAKQLGLCIPKIAPHDFSCAGCSYLSECFTPGQAPRSRFAELKRDAEQEDFEDIRDEVEQSADICDDRIMAMELLMKILDFLKANNDPATIQAFYNIADNKRDEFLVERNKKNAAAKKKI